MPTSCPSPAANFTVSANSYSDSTVKSASAPLSVTGCSSLKITPTFSVRAIRDTGDAGVKVSTDLTQPAAPDQATPSKVVLTLPPNVLGPNVSAVVSGGILCTDPTFASCKTIGSVRSTSPGYPAALIGKAYLTGSLLAPQITLKFPPPFPLTLSGAVDLATGSTTFTGVPDIPLTDLRVVLTGGPNSVFTPSCNPASGTASSTLTSQNGDQTATADAPFTVSNCPPPSPGPATGPVTTTKPPVTVPPKKTNPKPGRPQLRSLSLHKTGRNRFTLRAVVLAGNHAKGVRAIRIGLPPNVKFAVKRGQRLKLRKHVTTTGSGVASVKLVHHRLIIKLRHAVRRGQVSVRGLTVTGVAGKPPRRVHRRLKLVVSVTDAGGKSTRFAVRTLRVRVG
jgi:hypothetical protein